MVHQSGATEGKVEAFTFCWLICEGEGDGNFVDVGGHKLLSGDRGGGGERGANPFFSIFASTPIPPSVEGWLVVI